jgi:hypothetical protein
VNKQQAPYVRATDSEQEETDELFYFDAMMGRILDALAGIGLLFAFLAVCFFAGYLS